jgi:hypothetical protein
MFLNMLLFLWVSHVHGSLRITPAMQAGLTDRIWSLEEVAA